MIKTILSTLILATISLTASAEYIIKIPLEAAQGGALPDGSIRFNTTATTEPEASLSPLESYFGNNFTGVIDFNALIWGNPIGIAQTLSNENILSSTHKDLTLRVQASNPMGAGTNGVLIISVLLDCGDCRTDASLPLSFNAIIDGVTHIGNSCYASYAPYDELMTISDYTTIVCKFTPVPSIFTMGKNYTLIFNK